MLLAFHRLMSGPFRRLYESLPGAINPKGPMLNTYEGLAGTGSAGIYLCVVAQREDGKALYWQVEMLIGRITADGQWYATIKGEIDLDDDEGNDRCVLNEQRSAASGAEAAVAIRELGDTVSTYPIGELLSKQWEPEEVDDSADDRPRGSVSLTVRVSRRDSSGAPGTDS